MKKELCFKVRNIEIAALVFLYSSAVIFLFAWLKLYLAIISCAAIGYAFFRFIKSYASKSNKEIKISLGAFIGIIIFFTIVCIACGLGGFIYQSSDWSKHNAILRDLINYSWPVFYTDCPDKAMLTYYVSSYLIPALVGKITGVMKLAEITQLIWSVTGITVFFLLSMEITKAKTLKRQVFLAYNVVMFSSFAVVAAVIVQNLYPEIGSKEIFSSVAKNGDLNIFLQYTPNFVGIEYVFAQTIPMWLCSALLFTKRDFFEHYIFLLIPLAFYSVLCFVGITLTAVIYAAYTVISKKFSIEYIKKIFSLQNIFMLFAVCVPLGLYYLGNVKTEKPASCDFMISHIVSKHYLPVLILFIATGVGIYFTFFFKRFKKEPFFLISTAILVILPFFNMGFNNDLLLRATQCCLTFYMFFFIDFIFNMKEYRRKALMLLMIFGIEAVFHLANFGYCFVLASEYKTLYKERDEYISMSQFADKSGDPDLPIRFYDREALCFNYFTYDIDEDLFVQKLARRKDSDYSPIAEEYNHGKMYGRKKDRYYEKDFVQKANR